MEAFVTSPNGERVDFDFAQDSPYRLEPTHLDSELDLWGNNPTDIACNKLSALFDGTEPKDLVDVNFVVQELLPFHRLVVLTRQKHVGMDDYWLAMALARQKLKAFFLAGAEKLMAEASTAPEPWCTDGPGPRSHGLSGSCFSNCSTRRPGARNECTLQTAGELIHPGDEYATPYNCPGPEEPFGTEPRSSITIPVGIQRFLFSCV